MPRKLLINYAEGEPYEMRQSKSREMARDTAKFDDTRSFRKSDLSPTFRSRFNLWLNHAHGAGFWVWKPTVILKALQEADPGDLIFYLDVDWEFDAPANAIFNLMDNRNILLFNEGGQSAQFCTDKRTFQVMDCESAEYYDTVMLLAGMQCYKAGDEAIDFVTKYRDWVETPEALLPGNRIAGKPNDCHCYDQSILTLLAKKEGVPSALLPTNLKEMRKIY